MQKTSVALEPTACNCLALRQAARHVSQIYDAHLALVGLRTTQYSILAQPSSHGYRRRKAQSCDREMARGTAGI
jgi:hypothetical protein